MKKNSQLSNEIEKRLNDNSWDYKIASAVLEKKRKTKKRIIYSSVIFSLAAALVMIVFLFGIKNDGNRDIYHQFISRQVEGTYNIVFNNSRENSDIKLKDRDPLFLDDIDSIIDQSLAKRY